MIETTLTCGSTQKGLFKGTTDITFSPNTSMTRAMMVQVLHRLEGTPSAGESSYTDVANNEWYSDAINWATENKIVNGVGDNKFNPNEPITREQMAVMVYNYLSFKGLNLDSQSTTSYNDENKISSWAKTAVLALRNIGIMNGKENNNFDPLASSMRSEGATVTYNLDKYLSK